MIAEARPNVLGTTQLTFQAVANDDRQSPANGEKRGRMNTVLKYFGGQTRVKHGFNFCQKFTTSERIWYALQPPKRTYLLSI